MKNKGESLFLSIVVGVMIFMLGMLMINFLKPNITDARNSFDCNNLSISDGEKLTCLGFDSSMPYAIVLICSLAGGFIFKFIL